MSLISEVRSGSTLLGCFLRENLEPKGVMVEINQKLKERLVVRSRVHGHRSALLGTAIDYRLRLYFKEEPFYRLLAWRGLFGNPAIIAGSMWHKFGNGLLEYFVRFNNDISRLAPKNKRLSQNREDIICRHCFALARLEQVYRTGGAPITWPRSKEDFDFFSNFSGDTSKDFKPRIKRLLNSFHKQEINEARRMSWLFYESKQQWFKSKEVFLNPMFGLSSAVGGADGDIIIRHTYYDIKSTVVGVRNSDIFQMLAYPLLDEENIYKLERTGIYLARSGLSMDWGLEDLYSKIAKTNKTFYRFKREFYQVMNIYYKNMMKDYGKGA